MNDGQGNMSRGRQWEVKERQWEVKERQWEETKEEEDREASTMCGGW